MQHLKLKKQLEQQKQQLEERMEDLDTTEYEMNLIQEILSKVLSRFSNSGGEYDKRSVETIIKEVLLRLEGILMGMEEDEIQESLESYDEIGTEFGLDDNGWMDLLSHYGRKLEGFITSLEIKNTIVELLKEIAAQMENDQEEDELPVIATHTMEEMVDIIATRLENTKKKIEECQTQAKECLGKGNRKAALYCLKRKKLLSKHLQNLQRQHQICVQHVKNSSNTE
jgi:hypothetical protein